MYQQYETQAPKYLPEAKLRADINGRRSHIANAHREGMVYVLVRSCLPRVYARYTENDIHNPEGVARGIMNII